MSKILPVPVSVWLIEYPKREGYRLLVMPPNSSAEQATEFVKALPSFQICKEEFLVRNIAAGEFDVNACIYAFCKNDHALTTEHELVKIPFGHNERPFHFVPMGVIDRDISKAKKEIQRKFSKHKKKVRRV